MRDCLASLYLRQGTRCSPCTLLNCCRMAAMKAEQFAGGWGEGHLCSAHPVQWGVVAIWPNRPPPRGKPLFMWGCGMTASLWGPFSALQLPHPINSCLVKSICLIFLWRCDMLSIWVGKGWFSSEACWGLELMFPSSPLRVSLADG